MSESTIAEDLPLGTQAGDPDRLLDRYKRLLAETHRVRTRLDELARLEGRLLQALRGSGVAYRRLAREMASALRLGKSSRELRRLTERLRQQCRRRAMQERRRGLAAAEPAPGS